MSSSIGRQRGGNRWWRFATWITPPSLRRRPPSSRSFCPIPLTPPPSPRGSDATNSSYFVSFFFLFTFDCILIEIPVCRLQKELMSLMVCLILLLLSFRITIYFGFFFESNAGSFPPLTSVEKITNDAKERSDLNLVACFNFQGRIFFPLLCLYDTEFMNLVVTACFYNLDPICFRGFAFVCCLICSLAGEGWAFVLILNMISST